MKIQRILIADFLGVRRFAGDIAPLTLIAGPNESGKSSIRDAIALALTSDLPRVGLKKHAAELIHRPAAEASVTVETDGGTYSASLARSGKIGTTAPEDTGPGLLPYLLDMHRLSGATPDERRVVLARATGTAPTTAIVRERLKARGCNADLAERVMPLLRSGFPAAEAEVKALARDAKTRWKTVTHQTWGAQVAEHWTPPAVSAPPQGTRAELQATVESAQADLADAQEHVGTLRAQRKTAADLRDRISRLRTEASGYARIADEVAEMEKVRANLAEAAVKAMAEFDAAKNNVAEKNALECPWCAKQVKYDGHALVRHTQPADGHGVTANRLAELRQAAESLEQRLAAKDGMIASRKDAMAGADAAAKALAELEDQAAAVGSVSEDQVNAAQADAKAKAKRMEECRRAVADFMAYEAAVATDKKRLSEAAVHHAEVKDWLAIADALSPDGIPAELLREGLTRFNSVLADHAARAGWRTPNVDENGDIRYGTERLELCSESARWRADALLTVSLAKVSGVGLAVLDRLDVLDIPARAEAMRWLYGIRDTVQVIAMATLKAAPKARDGMASYWIGQPTAQGMGEAA